MNGTQDSEGSDSRRAAGESGRRPWWKDFWRMTRRRNGDGSLRDTLEELIERHEEDEHPIDPAERVLLENTLRLRNVTAEDISVPRADIVAVEIDTSLDDVIAVMGTSLHSRLPVYRKNLDDVVGMVHVKDVLVQARQEAPAPLSALIKQVLFISPSMRVLDLLLQMRLSRIHMALVVDEYGGIDGLVTIENIVEEIVGEIRDEHEIADARVSLEDFEEVVGPVLTDEEREDIDTLGGLVFTLIGRVPTRGELVTHTSGIEFEVLEGDPRRLKKLRIRNIPRLTAAAE
jgi:CBS domain containing-hemolysin-like protein